MKKSAAFSPDRKYRYALVRNWHDGSDKPFKYCAFIGLNPSTADETLDDPTIGRCITFARDLGFSALTMLNLFAWRDTKPSDMKKATDPVGPENDQWLLRECKPAGIVIAAWGLHGSHRYRALKVRQMFREANIKLHALRLTKGGHPEHPLYLPATLRPIPYDL